jgi:hypothetical protein
MAVIRKKHERADRMKDTTHRVICFNVCLSNAISHSRKSFLHLKASQNADTESECLLDEGNRPDVVGKNPHLAGRPAEDAGSRPGCLGKYIT